MPELPRDQARVLRVLYEWRFIGRGEGMSRSRLERVPDYILAAELDDSGVNARACLDVLVTRGLARRLERGDSGGTWTLPGGRVLRVSLRQTGEGPARLFYADVYVQDPGGPWRPIVELAGFEPCGTVFDLTPAGVEVAEQLPNSPAVRLGAGAAFMRAVENDPEARAALKRAQARLRAFAELLKHPEYQRERERARREQEQAFRALADAIRESVRAAQQDLGDLGFMPPKTLEDWEHLARIVEMPFETIQAGHFTARDVYVMALAWADRQRMKARLGWGDQATKPVEAVGPAKPTHSPDFTSVDWFGTRYTFAKGNQAESVRVLWDAWASGGHSVSQETIGDRIGSTARRFELAKTLRCKGPDGKTGPHPAWGTMIKQESKGSYRLAPPDSA